MKKLIVSLVLFTLSAMLSACGGTSGAATGDGSSQPQLASVSEASVSSGSADASFDASSASSAKEQVSDTASSSAPSSTAQSSGTSASTASEQLSASSTAQSVSATDTSGKVLIAYFSRMGNMDFDPVVDAVASASVHTSGSEHVSNNKIIADMLAEKTGGDVFFIEQTEKYPAAYRATTDRAKEEQNSGARPALASHVTNMAQYDTVILVYPNWWGALPRGVVTFLEEYNFSGKAILPLATHGGSGLGSGPDEIAALCPDAILSEGLAIHGSAVGDAKEDVNNWIDASGIL